MEAVKDVDKTPAIDTAKDEKATLDLLANLIFVLVVFGLEALIFFSSRDYWTAALLSLVAFVAAYIAYRVAVGSARSWGDAMQVVLDLHRDSLRTTLGLRDAKEGDDERALWIGARHVYLPGDDESPPGDLFEAQAPAALDVKAAGTVTVETVAAVVVDRVAEEKRAADDSDGIDIDALLRFVDYIFLVSRATVSGHGAVDVVVSDPRLRRIDLPTAPETGRVSATPTVREAGDTPQLQWRIERLAPGASVTLAYRLSLWRLELAGDAEPPSIEMHSGGIRLAFGNSKDKKIIVTLISSAPLGAPPKLTINAEETPMNLADQKLGGYAAAEHELVGDDVFWITLPAGGRMNGKSLRELIGEEALRDEAGIEPIDLGIVDTSTSKAKKELAELVIAPADDALTALFKDRTAPSLYAAIQLLDSPKANPDQRNNLGCAWALLAFAEQRREYWQSALDELAKVANPPATDKQTVRAEKNRKHVEAARKALNS